MKTYYSDEEIDALVNDVKAAFLDPAFQLAKSEGKKVDSGKEGGNGSEPEKEVALKDDTGDRAATMKPGQPSKTGQMPDSALKMAKADPKPEEAESASAAPAESASPEAAPESASPEAPEAPEGEEDNSAPEAPEGEGAEDPAQAHSADEIHEAYGQLDDESLKMHYEALKAVLMERMGGGGDQEAKDQSAAPPAPADQSAAPAMGEAPPAAQPPAMGKAEESATALSKAEEQIAKLTKSVEEMAGMMLKLASQPRPKAITEMAELSKTEMSPKLNKEQVDAKLFAKAKEQNLAKSDRALIVRYFTPNNRVKLEEIEHLLK